MQSILFLIFFFFFSVTCFSVVPYNTANPFLYLFLYSFPSEQNTNAYDDLGLEEEKAYECRHCMENTISDSDMILHLQLKIKNPFHSMQVKMRLDQSGSHCLLNPADLDLIFEQQEKQKIALSDLLCVECWGKFNKDNPRKSKSLVGDFVIPLPDEFQVFKFEIEKINQALKLETQAEAEAEADEEEEAISKVRQHIKETRRKKKKAKYRKKVKARRQLHRENLAQEAHKSQSSREVETMIFDREFNKTAKNAPLDLSETIPAAISANNKEGEAFGALSPELQNQDPNAIFQIFENFRGDRLINQLDIFTGYQALKDRFLADKNVLSTGCLSFSEEYEWIKMIYLDQPTGEGEGKFIFNSTIHPNLYKVVMDANGNGVTSEVRQLDRGRQWSDFLSDSNDQLKECQKLREQVKKSQSFDLSEVKEQLQECEKLKPQTEKPAYFDLSDLLSILGALDEEGENASSG